MPITVVREEDEPASFSCQVIDTFKYAPDCELPSITGETLTDWRVTRGSHIVIAALTSLTIEGIATLIGLSI
jgi:hypothetical protein